jgi:hypothetical protein
MNCDRAREIGHALLDGDLMQAARRQAFDTHVRGCSSCREWWDDLATMQRGLRELPQPGFPDSALEELWAATSRGPAAAAPRFRFDWRPLAAAAALTLALLGLSGLSELPRDRSTTAPQALHTEQEIAQATEQARLVFQLTARAINKAERTAVREIVDEVSPALRRMPLRWSAPEDDDEPNKQGV